MIPQNLKDEQENLEARPSATPDPSPPPFVNIHDATHFHKYDKL